VSSAIFQRGKYENEAEDPLSNFLYALRPPETKRQYPHRLKVFLDYLGLEGDLQDQAKQFLTEIRNNPQWAQHSLILFQKQRVDLGQISPSTVANCYKATKLFVEMNIGVPVINWKRVSRGQKIVRISRTVGKNQVVDELILSFTHDIEIKSMLPGIQPTGKYVELPHVVIMKFSGNKIVDEHVYWDQASLLAQIGLLDPISLPITGIEQSERLKKLSAM
jgi:hypothetical protein